MNDWLERNRTLVLTVVGLAIIIPLVSIALSYQRPSIIEIVPPAPSATPGLVTVHVSGAVAQPDVYELPPGSIARDAINAAGGPLRDADLNLVNLAQPLSDGQQVYVPIVGEEPPPLAGTESEESGPVNINTATASQLETLPGIGPSLAQAIIDYREANGAFTDITQIQNVPGIGEAKFEELKELMVVN